MTGNSFKYADEQWRQMEQIVSRAGGPTARDKFNAQRAAFEKMAGGWKARITKWNGRNFGHDETVLYRRVEKAALELKNALTDLTSGDPQRTAFPAIFIGNDVVWKGLAEMSLAEVMALSPVVPAHLADAVAFGGQMFSDMRENEERFARFLGALEHVAARAAPMAKLRRKQDRIMRDRFFGALGRVWRAELGLTISASVSSHFVAFIKAASEGIDHLQTRSVTRNAIAEVVREWPRRGLGCENGDVQN